jgi:hypothetical protein
MIFNEIIGRIKQETGIKNISELADFVGTTQPYMSKKKSQNDFSIKWAYQIATKYDLSTEWIMTGKGPKRISPEISIKNAYLLALEEWLNEIAKNDPRKEFWFQCSIEKTFPEFKEWIERKKGTLECRRVFEKTT